MRDGTRVLERKNERRENERRKANGKIFIFNILKVRIGELEKGRGFLREVEIMRERFKHRWGERKRKGEGAMWSEEREGRKKRKG